MIRVMADNNERNRSKKRNCSKKRISSNKFHKHKSKTIPQSNGRTRAQSDAKKRYRPRPNIITPLSIMSNSNPLPFTSRSKKTPLTPLTYSYSTSHINSSSNVCVIVEEQNNIQNKYRKHSPPTLQVYQNYPTYHK
eukprot:259177_1